jgi:hypothetical protein
MHWRELVIGSVATLIVTVLSGVAVYYATREPPAPPPAEVLVYEHFRSGIFASDTAKFSLHTIRLRNRGTLAAKNVVMNLDFPDSVKITDRSFTLSSGPIAGLTSTGPKPDLLEIKLRNLTPDEVLTTTIVVDADDSSEPFIGVKSDATTGTKLDSVSAIPEVSRSKWNRISSLLVPLAASLQIGMLFAIKPLLRFLRRWIPKSRSRNNTAFVYLLQNLPQHAESLLKADIETRGAEPISLANYGLALGLQGNIVECERHLVAAEFWADQNRQENAVISFNRFLLAILASDDNLAKQHLERAIRLDSNTKRYVSFADLVWKRTTPMPMVDELLTTHGIKRFQTTKVTANNRVAAAIADGSPDTTSRVRTDERFKRDKVTNSD